MGQLFVLCGPPGSGKTTLLNMIHKERPNLRHLKRFSTRGPRPEEGDRGKQNLEYRFLTPEGFAAYLARFDVANFIEWHGNFYSTDLEPIREALQSKDDYVLYEDMPSAVHLRRIFGSRITVILLFPGEEEDLRRLEFATLLSTRADCVTEWKRRLAAKYYAAKGEKPSKEEEKKEKGETRGKMLRAMMDLAFMVGRIHRKEDIRVLPNLRDQLEETFRGFTRIVDEVTEKRDRVKQTVFVLMKFDDSFNKIYRFAIKPAVAAQGLECRRGDETSVHLKVIDDIVHNIETADLIIADITGANANVFLELGISLTLNKRVILITQDATQPFDVNVYRSISYKDSLGGWDKLAVDIGEEIGRIREGESVLRKGQDR